MEQGLGKEAAGAIVFAQKIVDQAAQVRCVLADAVEVGVASLGWEVESGAEELLCGFLRIGHGAQCPGAEGGCDGSEMISVCAGAEVLNQSCGVQAATGASARSAQVTQRAHSFVAFVWA